MKPMDVLQHMNSMFTLQYHLDSSGGILESSMEDIHEFLCRSNQIR